MNYYDPQWWENNPGNPVNHPHLHGSPAFWRGPDPDFAYVYQQSELDRLKAYKYFFKSGALDQKAIPAKDCEEWQTANPNPETTPCKQWEIMPIGYFVKNQLSVSSNGNRGGTGVVWTTLQHKLPNTRRDQRSVDDPKTGEQMAISRFAAYDAETLRQLWRTPNDKDRTLSTYPSGVRRPLPTEGSLSPMNQTKSGCTSCAHL